ncbi:MAG: DedA family protein [Acidimicrobiales bacterium]
MSIHHLLTTYGYAAVFLLVAVESLGVPLPGETILIAASTYAGSTHRLSVWLILTVAAAAAIIGDNIGFWIGETGGYRLVRRYGHYVRVDETKMKVGRYIFDRHGGKVVFFGRFVSVLRTYAAFLAGTNRMSWRKFLIYNAAGGILWAAVYTFVSYAVGNAVNKVSGPVDIGLGVAAVVAVVTVFLVVRHQTGRLSARAEAAYPGPLGDS